MFAKCLQCRNHPPDFERRVYRDNHTGKVYDGVRSFCSDACEDAYLKEMDPEDKTFTLVQKGN